LCEILKDEGYLENIINSSADVITVVDMKGIVRSWNRAGEGIMGYRADEVIGRSNREFFVDPGEAERIMECVQRRGVIRNYRTIAINKDGRQIYLSISAALLKEKDGTPVGTVRVSRDITKEVMLERQIRRERDNMNMILDNMTDIVYLVSSEHKVEFMNRVAREVHGDCIGDICYEAFRRRDELCHECKHAEVMKGNIVRWEWDSTSLNKSFDAIEIPIRDVDGTISKLAIVREITERKRVEMEREKLIKELEIRNAEMERFIYTVSHGLRSPLITIQGFADMVQEDLEMNEIERARNELEYIKSSAAKMDLLLSDTLQLSRIGRIINEPVDVPFGELVQEAQEQLAGQIKSSNVEVSVVEDFPSVYVDRIRIVEVLVNLIENSINYMGEQPHPRIEIGYEEEDEKEVVIFVRDNGIGIEKSQHEKVFELFYRVDKSMNSKRTGAGLAIVKRIIEVHKGRVWIESEKDKGCTVCFTLPVTRRSSVDAG